MKCVLLLSIPIFKQGPERLSDLLKVTQAFQLLSLWFHKGQRGVTQR